MKFKCKICGRVEDDAHWINEKAQELRTHHMCFTCNHWRTQRELDLTERKDYGYAIINGGHFTLLPHTESYFKGHGGKVFQIRFNDGTEKTCDNLWFQGDIPDGYWREEMPDNAIFIND